MVVKSDRTEPLDPPKAAAKAGLMDAVLLAYGYSDNSLSAHMRSYECTYMHLW